MTEDTQSPAPLDWRAEIAARVARAEAAVAEVGIFAGFEFVPQSRSRYAITKDRNGRPAGGYGGKGEPCINWRVSLHDFPDLSERTRFYQCDYTQGIGHLPEFIPGTANRLRYRGLTSTEVESALKACETGRLENVERIGPAVAKIPKPDIAAVINSLLLDGSPYFNAQSFEEWASDLGYDTDSIKAKAAYDECVEVGRVLTRALGPVKLAALRTVFEDY